MEKFINEYLSFYSNFKKIKKEEIDTIKQRIEDIKEGRVVRDSDEPKKQYENDPQVHNKRNEIDLINQNIGINKSRKKQVEYSTEYNLRDKFLIQYSCGKEDINLNDKKKKLEYELESIKQEYQKSFEQKTNKQEIDYMLTKVRKIIQEIKKERKQIKDFFNQTIQEKERLLSETSEKFQPNITKLETEIAEAEEYLKIMQEEIDERLQELKEETIKRLEKELIEKRLELEGLQSYYNGKKEEVENELQYLKDLLNNFKNDEKDFKEEIKSELKGLLEKLVDNKKEDKDETDKENENELVDNQEKLNNEQEL